ncbi:hypothetical protein N9094_01380 [bacterium]|nr:hypothetical protein [Verrucomicrobiales bacterium]MDB4507835.1 hypothetical protein [bacterium]MDB4772719.1 hypothetical protein [Verrucomicrobiales bacterium]MDC0312488.1 hypothetical protein [Verrucomicrobiales bacterium]MDF1788105.1 hypothetical protein [Verrucomicrobiales bacterium]
MPTLAPFYRNLFSGTFDTDIDSALSSNSAVSSRSLESYQRYIASGKNVSVWEGKRTALALDRVDDPSTYDQEVMTELVGVFDKVFAA